jgi:hypothetical protein
VEEEKKKIVDDDDDAGVIEGDLWKTKIFPQFRSMWIQIICRFSICAITKINRNDGTMIVLE